MNAFANIIGCLLVIVSGLCCSLLFVLYEVHQGGAYFVLVLVTGLQKFYVAVATLVYCAFDIFKCE